MHQLLDTIGIILYDFARFIARIAEFISIITIAIAILIASYRMITLSIKRYKDHKDINSNWLKMREAFEETLMMGLQILVAADIILTISDPDIKGIIMLATIVILRIILGLALSREIAEIEKRENRQNPDCATSDPITK